MNRSTLAITAFLFHATMALSPNLAKAETADATTPESQIDDARVTATVRAVRRARASTVNIHSEKRASNIGDAIFQSGRDRKVNGMGTGIVIDERGYIVTNHHVVADVDSLRVTLFDGSAYTARVVSYDRRQDLAIIKIDPTRKLETLPLGTSSDLMLGEDVIAIGNSFGYEHTITRGIVSSLSRDVEVNEEQAYHNLIQTDTAINPGNSGGPLINRNGDVIGINVAIRAGAQKIGFAIPIDDARRVIARLMSVEQLDKMYHGLTLEDRKSGDKRELVVRSVTPNSPAAKAGFKPGDIVSNIDGKETVDSADFERLLLGRSMGEQIPLTLQRNDEPVELSMTLTSLDPRRAQTAYTTIDQLATKPVSNSIATTPAPVQPAEPSGDPAWDVFGLQLAPVGRQVTREGKQYRGGMKVVRIDPKGVAYKEHIRTGDVIVGLSKWETVSDSNINYVIREARRQTLGSLKFYILRQGETLFGDLQVASAL